jgi:hypothetical protein
VKSKRIVRGLLPPEVFCLLVLSHDTDLKRDSCHFRGIMVHYTALINCRYFKHGTKNVLGPESDEVCENFEILHIEKLRKIHMSRILCSDFLLPLSPEPFVFSFAV